MHGATLNTSCSYVALQFVSHSHSRTQLRMHDNKKYYKIHNDLTEIILKQKRKKDITSFFKLDVCGSVHHSIIHIENPTRCHSLFKFSFHIYMKINMFSGHTPPTIRSHKTALAASGFAYVEDCWPCSCTVTH